MNSIDNTIGIGDKVLYFGCRDVILTGTINEIREDQYIIMDEISKSLYVLHKNLILDTPVDNS